MDLFSGIGGLALGLAEWVRPVAYCDNDPYCQAVLLQRMRSGDLARAPIWDDITTLQAEMLPEIDIIYGGFPCQDISVAGHGKGLEGKRSRLFFEVTRLVRELRPAFVFLENVPAITFRGLERILMEFTSLGYDCRWTIVSAKEVGACHIRERWFLLAYANGDGGRLQSRRGNGPMRSDPTNTCDNSKNIADSHGKGLERCGRKESQITRPASYNGWKSQPTVRGGINGLSYRVDRVRTLGNAVVPLQAKRAFRKEFSERLMGIE